MQRLVKLFCICSAVLVVPTTALAQAAIAGLVKDASGAVLPGVTVEAASPALIEKTRTATTDGTGQYRIESLQPGTYTRDVHARGVLHLEARRRRCCRAPASSRSTPT